MDKKRLEIGTFIVIGLAILAVWGWQSLKPQVPQLREVALQTPEIREVKIEDETSQYKISVSYPEFQNSGDPASESAANDLIKSKVQQSIADFKGAIESDIVDIPEAKSELGIKYGVVYLNPSVASIKMSEYTYIEGAAHPLGIYWPFNFNFKDKKEIALSDLFRQESNYLTALSELSREGLKKQLGEDYNKEAVEAGTEPIPKAGNFSTFFFDKDKLTIVFNVYQVAGYAAGAQTVEIPYEALSGAINEGGAIPLVRQ